MPRPTPHGFVSGELTRPISRAMLPCPEGGARRPARQGGATLDDGAHPIARPAPAAGRPRRGFLAAGLGLASSAALRAAPARARQGAGWPERPVRYINGFPPGGPTDTLSRIWCARMAELAGQQFVVENRGGSGGVVGADAIAKAPPDGYTIGLGGIAQHAIAPSLYPSLPYDPVRDFTFVSGLWQLPNLLVVHPDLPARSVPELVALLKANPGRYSYASSGAGTTLHLSGELFKATAGVDVVHVPYRGSAPAMVDVVAGRVQMIFDNIPSSLAQVRDGKLRPLAVTGARRSPAAPGVPTMAEFLPGFEVVSWSGVCGPAGVPAAAVRRMSELSRRALESAEVARGYSELGATPWWTTPEEFARYRAEQEAVLAPVVKASGARVD
jgi:tripartite-type tricarboxylate transporter receptor subunit TctC